MITEIAPDVYRISFFAADINLQFNQFLILDEEPGLFHTGLKVTFPFFREQVEHLVDPSKIRWISFSHFESDECGALNSWLAIAPSAIPVCGLLGAEVNINDFSDRSARILQPGEVMHTGEYRFRYVPTAHVPHGWDAGLLYEESEQTLFCSDLFHQWGETEALTTSDLTDRARDALITGQEGPFANYVPYTHQTGRVLEELAGLNPQTLATMHGASFAGDGAQAIRNLAEVFREVLGPPRMSAAG